MYKPHLDIMLYFKKRTENLMYSISVKRTKRIIFYNKDTIEIDYSSIFTKPQ
jgi:hypothetical protein